MDNKDNDLTLEKFESAYRAFETAEDWESRRLAVTALANLDYTKFPSVMAWFFSVYPRTFLRYYLADSAVTDMLNYFSMTDPKKGVATYERLVGQRPLRDMTAKEYESHKDIITRIVSITLDIEGDDHMYNLCQAMMRLGLDGCCPEKKFRERIYNRHRKLTRKLHMNMMEQEIKRLIKENSNDENNG